MFGRSSAAVIPQRRARALASVVKIGHSSVTPGHECSIIDNGARGLALAAGSEQTRPDAP
jgi:hypothetical protein